MGEKNDGRQKMGEINDGRQKMGDKTWETKIMRDKNDGREK